MSKEGAAAAIGCFIIGGLVALALVSVVVCPLITIAAANCLFGTSIQFTFWNWLAALWLGGPPFVITFGLVLFSSLK